MRSSAPKRRLDVRQQPRLEQTSRPSGKRAATRQRRSKRRLLPTPAMVGVLALLVAGVGSVAISSRTAPESLASNYQTISANYAGGVNKSDAPQPNPDPSLDISRDFDRKVLTEQVKKQTAQRNTAVSQLVSKTQQRAEELKLNQWVIPVAGYNLTARFGQRSSLWSTVHTGLDFAGPSGTTIVALAAGTVKSASYDGAYGNRTVITLLDGTEVWYCHQSRISVQPGDKVNPGQTVGYTGSTGNVTGPHLHLEIHPGGGDAVDPYPELVSHDVQP